MKIKKLTRFLKFFLGSDVIGITIAPFGIYLNEDYLTDPITINHEKIHWKQQVEMLIIPFYIWYIVELLWKKILHGKMAYYAISFERESYYNDTNLQYLDIRKPYNWINYLTFPFSI